MFRPHVWSDVGLVVCDSSWYETVWESTLTTGFRVSECSRTNTDSVLFLACTRPPDFDTDHGAKTRIPWQLQSNEDILLRPHLRKDQHVEIVLGHLVIMRISVHLCQRKFLNKHLHFSIHVSHTSFIPFLVAKSYAPCICHVRTFPVLLTGL